jgi:hypothetical protein
MVDSLLAEVAVLLCACSRYWLCLLAALATFRHGMLWNWVAVVSCCLLGTLVAAVHVVMCLTYPHLAPLPRSLAVTACLVLRWRMRVVRAAQWRIGSTAGSRCAQQPLL